MSPSSSSTSASAGGDLGIGQHTGRLALDDEELYLLKLLQIGYRHPFPYGAQGPARGRRAQSNRSMYTVTLQIVKSSGPKRNFR